MADRHVELLLICANLLPIGTYFCVLGLVHAAGRPLVTTAARDFLALALAVSGLAINGPLDYLLHSRLLPEFFTVHSRAAGFGVYLILVAALAPRSYETLVIYNCGETFLVSAVRRILEQLGLGFQEVPGGWMVAGRGVTLEIESLPALHNICLHFRGMRDRTLFQQVHHKLGESLATVPQNWSAVGFLMAAAGGLILALPIWMFARDPQSIAILFRQVLETW